MMIDYPTTEQIPQLKKLWEVCFQDPESFIDGFFATDFSSQRCRCIGEGGRVIAALYWLDGEYKGRQLAYLYAVATHPDYRGKGLCRELMADTHDLLRIQGYAAALLLPGEPGLREMYRKLGYRDCCGISSFSCEAGETIPVTEISWQEYETLRPGFLPEKGANQQGIQFLGTYCRFYRGEKFLLAAAQSEESFAGMELLGDRNAAPGILGALGAKNGTFRTPGGKPGAMALSLDPSAELPGYLGLTFD